MKLQETGVFWTRWFDENAAANFAGREAYDFCGILFDIRAGMQ